MIPVTLKPEPADFDAKVRQPGRRWLKQHGIDFNAAPPEPAKLPNYWRDMNKDLWEAYGGVCAYLAIFFEFAIGASSTDHFIAKSRNAGGAYEWDNYRLACLAMNRNKNKFDDILDPVTMAPETFFLNFVTGEIEPNPELHPNQKKLAEKTINRLKLNSAVNNKMRADRATQYFHGMVSLDFLQRQSPFVYYEVVRQGLQLG